MEGKLTDLAILGDDGLPKEATPDEWIAFSRSDRKRIGSTDIEIAGKTCNVSTVFLPCDHGAWLDGPSLWFETMVFYPRGDFSDKWCERYTTIEEAKAGHRRIVEQLEDLVRTELVDEEYWDWLG